MGTPSVGVSKGWELERADFDEPAYRIRGRRCAIGTLHCARIALR